ncbi:MAG: hypothetical protein IJP62_03345 [Treponema sp.]|nr:hypothetical protein [Treponema sp.]
MSEAEFVDAVQNMRDLQKAYFRNRDPTTLHRAKYAEQHVDRILAEYQQANGLEKQLGLFGRGLACK